MLPSTIGEETATVGSDAPSTTAELEAVNEVEEPEEAYWMTVSMVKSTWMPLGTSIV